MTTHPQVRMRTPGGQRVHVDQAIRPLIRWLWDQGCSTRYSCQGDIEEHDPAMVVFMGGADPVSDSRYLVDLCYCLGFVPVEVETRIENGERVSVIVRFHPDLLQTRPYPRIADQRWVGVEQPAWLLSAK